MGAEMCIREKLLYPKFEAQVIYYECESPFY